LNGVTTRNPEITQSYTPFPCPMFCPSFLRF